MIEDEELERIKRKKIKELLSRASGVPVKKEFPDKPIQIDEKSFDEVLKKYPLVLVDFWAAWCGPCLMIEPIIEQLAREYSGKVVFAKVDVDRNRRLAARLRVMNIPTLMIFKNGKLVDMIIGTQPKPAIEQILRKYF